jgi:multiple sugar transport system ATP-binding protein
MNFFEAGLVRSGDTLALQSGPVRIDLPRETTARLKDYRETQVLVGIRPEDLQLADEAVAGRTISATVEVVEPIGSETYVDADAGPFPLIAGVGRGSRVRPHQSILLVPAVEHVHLFHIRDEAALLTPR